MTKVLITLVTATTYEINKNAIAVAAVAAVVVVVDVALLSVSNCAHAQLTLKKKSTCFFF